MNCEREKAGFVERERGTSRSESERECTAPSEGLVKLLRIIYVKILIFSHGCRINFSKFLSYSFVLSSVVNHLIKTCLAEEKVEKDWEREEPSVIVRCSEITSRALPSPQFAVWLVEVA